VYGDRLPRPAKADGPLVRGLPRRGFGGYKQSGIGREGGEEGVCEFLESKTMLLDAPPAGYEQS
jgi:acyl-CoA reductase-like NAD-dependent aldehyde dehydrogenase